eukprot:maker-scaffold638_size121162-snap-gene-0.33 protein:Tk11620 transcript:maker-scaffold638_size121162-snap-gene-0.33-mRNA-1 annotation:"PREDICTED: uncharacterized protein LOC664222 isoform X2"
MRPLVAVASLPWIPWIFIILLALDVSQGVEIIDLIMPETAESGNESEIVLDCDYDFSEEERSQLDIKWYFNEEHIPFFQWIPGQGRKPQLIGDRFADHIDLDFVSHEDEAKQYRALKIINPGPQLSGSYRCKVSTLIDEDFKQKQLLVFVPPESIDLELEAFDDLVNITCLVSGVFPEPILSITWEGSGTTFKSFEETIIYENPNNSMYFDGLLKVELNASQISAEVETTFICQISLPQTNFSMSEEMIFLAPRSEIEEVTDDDDDEDFDADNPAGNLTVVKEDIQETHRAPENSAFNSGLVLLRDPYVLWTLVLGSSWCWYP